MNTPWGKSQTIDKVAPGITFVSTAGHGGFKVSADKLRKMHPALRTEDGWFEEDCEWAKVAFAFPEHFQENYADAVQSMKDWYPSIYEEVTGEVLQPGESRKKDEQRWFEENKRRYIVTSAWGDWHEKVPKGYVAVLAEIGGRRGNDVKSTDPKFFLIPQEEYKKEPGQFGFVVDRGRHQETAPIY